MNLIINPGRFHLLLERRKNKDEQVEQWLIGQTSRPASKALLFASPSRSAIAGLPSAGQIDLAARLGGERWATCEGRIGAWAGSKHGWQREISGFVHPLNDSVRDCSSGRSS